MALVDYSSSDEDPAEEISPPQPPPPPLPASFHDLYASTVRTSTRDDPALHQGRTRQIPHVPGNWPSHVYVEWFPPQHDCNLLASLVTLVRPEASQQRLHSFLTSDLGAPQPLHVSLSRPLALPTHRKDAFLARLAAATPSCPRFAVRPAALAWHRSPDSNRAFLVLRVRQQLRPAPANPGLASLLRVCNGLARDFDLPQLYAVGDGDDVEGSHDCFHVSVAWAFVEVTEDLQEQAAAVFQRFCDRLTAIEIPVHSVKVKIGNVVTSLELAETPRRLAARS